MDVPGLELIEVYRPLSPKCWGSGYALPHLTLFHFLQYKNAYHIM